MDPLKEAFQRVREDIRYLYREIESIKQLLTELKTQQTNQQTIRPTNQHINPTNQHTIPTHKLSPNGLKHENYIVSTRNEGVPTNQQTNQPTDQHPVISTPTQVESSLKYKEQRISNIQKVSEILSTLDDIKKEVRLKFKRLTEQEMLVFSTIYSFEEQGFVVDYSLLAQKLNLTEISIRDYIHKILKKEIPLIKSKEANKKIVLSIPQELKRIASLQTIFQLRNI